MSMRDLLHWHSPNTRRNNGGSGRSLWSLQDDMNNLFDDFSRGLVPWGEEMSYPSIDVLENIKHYKVNAEIPGLNPEDVDVSVSNGVLTIRGEKKSENEEKEGNYIRRESSYGSFQRSVLLPDAADVTNAEATFKNGILNIMIPKKADAEQNTRKIEIKRG